MTVYRLWPATSGPGIDAGDHSAYTMGMRFVLSAPANLTAVYWWRATASSPAPTQCGVFDDDTGVLVAAAETFADPGAATGWIRQQLATPVPLSAAQAYRIAVYGATLGYSATANYWDTGSGSAGITSGIIAAPNNTNAGGQDKFHSSGSPMTYPDQSFNAGNYWIDLEVTTGSGTSLPLNSANETDTAIGFGRAKARALLPVVEIDTALPFSVGGGPQIVPLLPVYETDTARAIAVSHSVVTVPASDLTDFWVHTVGVEPYLGTTGGGVRTYGPKVTVPGFLVHKRTLVRNENAEQVLSESQFYGDVSLAGYFPPRSRVTVNGNPTTVITIGTHTSGDLELPDHIVVYLQ